MSAEDKPYLSDINMLINVFDNPSRSVIKRYGIRQILGIRTYLSAVKAAQRNEFAENFTLKRMFDETALETRNRLIQEGFEDPKSLLPPDMKL